MFFKKTKIIFLLIGFIYVFLFITNAEPYVRSDGWYYFHTAKCLLNENKFTCSTKPNYWDNMDLHTRTILNDKYISVASVGTSLIYLPGLFVAEIIKQNFDANNEYFLAYNGHTIFDGLSILATSIILNIGFFLLIYKIIIKLGYSKKAAIIAILLITISQYILWYVFILPIFTHTAEIFFSTLIIYLFLKINEKIKPNYVYLLVIAVSTITLIRPIMIIVFLPFLFLIIRKIFLTQALKTSFRLLIGIILSVLPFIIIYFWYNYESYGSIISSGYSTRQENFTSTFNGLNLLFSIYRGWFTYSPLALIGLIGLFVGIKKYKTLSISSLYAIFAGVIIYGFWPNWWGGGSYGSRFMLYTTPFLVIGLCEFFEFIKKLKFYKQMILKGVISVSLLYSLCLMILYRFTYFGTDFYTPLAFVKYHIDLYQKSNNIRDFLIKEITQVQIGSGLLVLAFNLNNPVFQVDYINDTVTLKLSKQPQHRQMQDFNLKMYIIDKQNKHELCELVYPIDPNNSQFTINYTDLCIYQTFFENKKFIIDKHSAFYLTDQKILIIERPKGIQFRGDKVLWNHNDTYYKI